MRPSVSRKIGRKRRMFARTISTVTFRASASPSAFGSAAIKASMTGSHFPGSAFQARSTSGGLQVTKLAPSRSV